MRKIILALAIVVGLFISSTSAVSAAACANWICDTTCDEYEPYGCTQTCYCGDNDTPNDRPYECGPGLYVCNDPDGSMGCCPIGGVPTGGGWTCFAAGTKVRMASGDNFNIEDIKVGDKVVSQDEQGNKSVSTVVKLDQPIREHMCRVDFAVNGRPQGSPLRMTNEHPLMTAEGWKFITPSKTAADGYLSSVQSALSATFMF